MGRPGLSRHRKFKRLARSLDDEARGFGETLARGCLETLWDAVYESGDDYLGDANDVEALAGWNGKAGLLTAALLGAGGGEGAAGFIEEAPNKPGRFQVHDLWDHAPDYVRKRRSRENERRTRGAELRSLTGQRPEDDRAADGQCPPTSDGESEDGRTRTPAPAPTPTPAPARTPAPSRAGGKSKVCLGPLGAQFVYEVTNGIGKGSLAPLTSSDDAEGLEAAIEQHGGVAGARAYIAATYRRRQDFDPHSVKLLLDVLRDPLPREAAS